MSSSGSVIIIQRRDTYTGLWVDAVTRHSIWKAHLTARRQCRVTGHDYRIVAAHSGAVLETALAAELGLCCPIDCKVINRPHYGLEAGT
ncbi:MAG: hypothetical protein ACO3QB_13615 [bacterium]